MNTAREVNRSAQRPPRANVQQRRKPLKDQVLGGYWRVPALAVAGALLAFTVSFIFPSQYSGVARLIIHPNDNSYSGTDSGAETAGSINVGGIDITKQTTLGNTLVNLSTSNEAAAEIVKRIGVDKINGTSAAPSLSMTDKIKNFLKVGQTGATPTAEQAAIEKVKGSLNVVVLDESWVMEITAWNPDPKLAGEIANTAADVAVEQSEARFRANAQRELDYVNQLVAASRTTLEAKAQAVQDFESTLTSPAATAAGAGQVAVLNDDLSNAQARHKALEDRQAAVAAMVSKQRFDSSRLGAVVVSTAPGRPMRYLFLLVGALVGALSGLLLTWFRSIREEEQEAAQEEPPSRGVRQADGGRRGAPDVRFETVVDVRDAPVPLLAPTGSGDRTAAVGSSNPTQQRSATQPGTTYAAPPVAPLAVGVRSSSSTEPSVPGRSGNLSQSEASSIAAALFNRPESVGSHG